MPVPTPAKRAAIVAAALLLGAPTAGAALRSEAPKQMALSDGVLRIEHVIPPEPEVHPAYPLATLDAAPPNDFERPPRTPHWGYGFPGMEAVAMSAEPQAAGVAVEPTHSAVELHSSFEPASEFIAE